MQKTEIPSVPSSASRIPRTSTGDGIEGISIVVQDPNLAIHRLSLDPEKPTDKDWLQRYNRHIASFKWSELRGLIFEREGGICQGCAEEPIEHVHHLTYAHMGNEFLFELMGLCITCHLRVHGVQKFKQGFK